MNRYIANLYDPQDIAVRDAGALDNGLAFSMSATSGRHCCQVKAPTMDAAIDNLTRRAVRDGWSGKQWSAHITRLNRLGHPVVRNGKCQLITPSAEDYRHVEIFDRDATRR